MRLIIEILTLIVVPLVSQLLLVDYFSKLAKIFAIGQAHLAVGDPAEAIGLVEGLEFFED